MTNSNDVPSSQTDLNAAAETVPMRGKVFCDDENDIVGLCVDGKAHVWFYESVLERIVPCDHSCEPETWELAGWIREQVEAFMVTGLPYHRAPSGPPPASMPPEPPVERVRQPDSGRW
jgi:hypothetical protein